MARVRLLTKVRVNGKGWSATYFPGKYYSANHMEFLPEGSYEVVEQESGPFDFEEPELFDPDEGIE